MGFESELYALQLQGFYEQALIDQMFGMSLNDPYNHLTPISNPVPYSRSTYQPPPTRTIHPVTQHPSVNNPKAKNLLQEHLNHSEEFLFPHESDPNYSLNGTDSMSESKYRATYLRGKDQYKSFDVGHILSAKNGGADAVQNYHMEDKYLNRVVASDRLDPFHAYVAGEERTAAAVRVSQRDDVQRRYPDKIYKQGNQKAIARELYEEGREIAQSLGLKRNKNNSGWDKRSSAFRSGDAKVTKSGEIDGRCKMVRRSNKK